MPNARTTRAQVSSVYGASAAITPSNTADLPDWADALICTAAGTLSVLLADGSTLTLASAITVNTILPLHVKRVLSTGTTGTWVALFF